MAAANIPKLTRRVDEAGETVVERHSQFHEIVSALCLNIWRVCKVQGWHRVELTADTRHDPGGGGEVAGVEPLHGGGLVAGRLVGGEGGEGLEGRGAAGGVLALGDQGARCSRTSITMEIVTISS